MRFIGPVSNQLVQVEPFFPVVAHWLVFRYTIAYAEHHATAVGSIFSLTMDTLYMLVYMQQEMTGLILPERSLRRRVDYG